jgi:2-hydroxy-3-keto-5-methylthiopentenyl-1-phosphate phosphatase
VSDRFGVRYADLVFAKDALAKHCRAEAIPFRSFEDFDDVRHALQTLAEVTGPVGGEPCPGWRERA